jgi:ATP-dependent helicase HrpA
LIKAITDIDRLRYALRDRLAALPPRDRRRLGSRLERARSIEELAAAEAAIARAEGFWAAWRARLPVPAVRPELPIAAQAETLARAIAEHPVLIVAGETGSGKTTQLPKIALRAGRGREGRIGLTQPRRLAARAAARRLAEELGCPLGALVGYETRFERVLGEGTVIKCMTDGILLAELASDRKLLAYDTLILDEVHERSLNIDFLLGYLCDLLPRRPELRVILSSATLEAERLAKHFGGAPVFRIEGRLHPVEIRWRPPGAEEDLGAAVEAVLAEIEAESEAGDVLVFLPGEREIRELSHRLRASFGRRWEVLPLYARLPAALQERVFRPGPARRVVLATNVAETSLTVPRIRYVIDSGLVRVMRYRARLGISRLSLEPIAQAAAVQRAGRCGRLGPGVCYRLYDEEAFRGRSAQLDPEIRRSALATVLLRLLALGVRDPERFPFLDPPTPKAVREGLRELSELQALAGEGRLSERGRRMAMLPVDARLAALILAGERLGCLEETLVLAAFLALEDPRERPPDRRAEAERAHAAWRVAGSDFAGILALWRDFERAAEEGSSAALRRWCEASFLSFARMREWRALHRELRLAAARAGLSAGRPRVEGALERALLAAFPGFFGRLDERGDYRGPRGRVFRPFPGSALARRGERLIFGAPLIELERRYALFACRLDPRLVEAELGHLLARRLLEPMLSPRDGRVLAYEELSLDGFVLVARRRVELARFDRGAARALFLREGLAEGRWEAKHPWVEAQRQRLAEARAIAERLRRPEVLRPAEAIAEWLAARLPETVVDGPSFLRWWQRASAAERAGVELGLTELVTVDPASAEPFPLELQLGGRRFPLRYRFAPGAEDDGVTLELPIECLGVLADPGLTWLVPGLLPERVAALIRSLPKSLRRHFSPAAEFARAFLASEPPQAQPLTEALSAFLRRATGVALTSADFREESIPAHLRLRVALLGRQGALIAASRDLAVLTSEQAGRAREALAERFREEGLAGPVERFPERDFRMPLQAGGAFPLWPALVQRADEIRLEAFSNREEALTAHRAGVLALLRRDLGGLLRRLCRELPVDAATALRALELGGKRGLAEQVLEGALEERYGELWEQVPALDPLAYARLREALESGLFRRAVERLALCARALQAAAEAYPRLKPPLLGYAAANYEDLARCLRELLPPDFARRLPAARLAELPRYLRALAIRAERLERDPARDQARMLELKELERALAAVSEEARREALFWQLQELRVAIFAPELGTPVPVSFPRLRRALAAA